MFFDDVSQLPELARRANFVILAVDSATAQQVLTKAFPARILYLTPDEKTQKISVEMVREFTTLTDTVDKTDRFFCVLQAETLNPAAQNAFLKNLEEPQATHHFILVTKTPSALLPTVLSRAQVFYLRETGALTKPVTADDKVKTLAKQLIVADVPQLLALANDLAKCKDNARAYAMTVVGTAIEILYKSYLATGQPKFLKKLPNLLKLYDNLAANGHLKLHIVADMI